MIDWHQLKDRIEPGMLQLGMALALTIFGLVWEPLGLPDVTEFIRLVTDLFAHYGLPIVFIASFIEGFFMVNFYFPGSFVVLLAVSVLEHSFSAYATLVLVVWAACMCAVLCNYILGRYGFYRALLWLGSERIITRMQAWLDRRGNLAVLLSGIHPNFLAVAAVCMGIARESVTRSLVLAGVALALWLPTEAGIFMLFSPQPTESVAFYWYLIAIFAMWGVAAIVLEEYRHRRRVSHTT